MTVYSLGGTTPANWDIVFSRVDQDGLRFYTATTPGSNFVQLEYGHRVNATGPWTADGIASAQGVNRSPELIFPNNMGAYWQYGVRGVGAGNTSWQVFDTQNAPAGVEEPPPPPPPDPTVTPITRIRVDVYGPNGVDFIAEVVRRDDLQWQDELNGVGVGKFQIHTEDPLLVEYPNLLDHGNVVKFLYEDAYRFAFRIESVETKLIDASEIASQWKVVQGRGLLSMLQDAVVYPEYGLRSVSGDQRLFGFASKHGTWYDPAHWTKPVTILPAQDTTARGTTPPKGWPDADSRWMSSDRSPNADAPPGTIQWFRAVYDAPTAGNLKIFFVADNFLTIYVNGEPVVSTEDQNSNNFLWRETGSVLVTVRTGPVTIGVRVLNGGATSIGNPVCFMLSMWTVNSVGAHIAPVLRTDNLETDESFRAYTGPLVPGWRASDILLTLVDESKTRGVQALEYLQPAFNASTDSTGLATFTDRQESTARIGFESILDVAARLTEASVDLNVTPTMQLQCWVSRGVDRTTGPDPVKLEYKVSLIDHKATTTAATVTRLIVRSADGKWQEVVDAPGEAASGRKEAGLSLGNSQKGTAEMIARKALEETARPKFTIDSSGMPARDVLKPYVHFGIGDIVLTLDQNLETYAPVHVLALTITENDQGVVFFTPELSQNLEGRKAPKTIEQRQQAWTKSIMGGTLGGAVENAAPVANSSSLEDASSTAGRGGGGEGSGAYVAPERKRTTFNTGLLVPGEAVKDRILMSTRFRVCYIETSAPARVRLYSRVKDRDADFGRPLLYDPSPNIGIVMDYLTADGFLEAPLSPEPEGSTFDEDDPALPGSNEVPITVTSIEGGSVTVTLTYIHLE